MAINRGKQFEQKFKTDWQKSFPHTWIYRLPDQVSCYKGASRNPCDFLAYHSTYLWMLECKETKEGTLNFSKIGQFDLLQSNLQFDGVKPYLIIWFEKFDKVFAVPFQEVVRMKDDGLKSVSLKNLEKKLYNNIEIPSVKKRVFLDSDYSVIVDFENNTKEVL